LSDYLEVKKIAPPVFRFQSGLSQSSVEQLRRFVDGITPWSRWLNDERTAYAVMPHSPSDLKFGWTALGLVQDWVAVVPTVLEDYAQMLGVSRATLDEAANRIIDRWPLVEWDSGPLGVGEPIGVDRRKVLFIAPQFQKIGLVEALGASWSSID